MDCQDCRTPALRFPVPEDLQGYAPDGAAGAAICPTCLAVQPDDAPPISQPDFAKISEEYPTDPDVAVPMSLAIGLLRSLALYRSEIDELFDLVEQRGVDPMLVLDRLSATREVDSGVDLAGRKRQLEQLLE